MIAVDPPRMDTGTGTSKSELLVVGGMNRSLAVVAPGGALQRPHGLFQFPENEVGHYRVI